MIYDKYAKAIGIELRVARIRKGLTVAELSKRTGLSPQTIHRAETGKVNTGILTLKSMVDELDISLRDIL